MQNSLGQRRRSSRKRVLCTRSSKLSRHAFFLLALCLVLSGCVSLKTPTNTSDNWLDAQGGNAVPALAQRDLPLPTPEPTPVPTPTVPPVLTANIRIVGDIMVHDNQLTAAHQPSGEYDFMPFFELIAPSLQVADLTVGNLETTLSGQEDRGYSGYPRFNSPDSLLTAIQSTGMDVITFANNHVLDRKMPGLIRTLDKIENAGFLTTGSNRTPEEREELLIISVNGIQVGILAYTFSANGMEDAVPPEDVAYAIQYLRIDEMRSDIDRMREAGAEFIIVCPHWGQEYKRQPGSTMRTIAQELAEAGADAIVGCHPHMVQPIETLEVPQPDGSTKQVLVAYSLGNFISDQRAQYKDTGIILSFDLRKEDGKTTLENPGYIPTWVYRGEVGDSYAYRILPISQYLDADMSDFPGVKDRFIRRMKEAWVECTELIGDHYAKPM